MQLFNPGFCFFGSGAQALSVRSQVNKLGRNHNATPSTLGVLFFLLVVEGQGATFQSRLQSGCQPVSSNVVNMLDTGTCNLPYDL